MFGKGLSLLEIIYLRRKGRSDACRSFVFQDVNSGTGYPKRFLKRKEAKHYRGRQSSPYTDSIYDANDPPAIASPFMNAEIARFYDERDRFLAGRRYLVRNGRFFPLPMRFSEACRLMEKNVRDIAAEQLLEAAAAREAEKRYQLYKDAVINAEISAAERQIDTRHLDVLFEQRLYSLRAGRTSRKSRMRKKERAILSEEKSLCDKMNTLLERRCSHRLLRISYYYQCAQKRQPLLPVLPTDPDVLAEMYHMDVLGTLADKISYVNKALAANPVPSANAQTTTDKTAS